MNMMFLNSSQNIQNNNNINQNQSLPNMVYRRNRFIRPLNNMTQQPAIQTPIIEDPKPKMIWGQPIWFLFHTLAEKIKPEFFSTIIKELLNMNGEIYIDSITFIGGSYVYLELLPNFDATGYYVYPLGSLTKITPLSEDYKKMF
jgi:hypothetical protein